MARPKRRKPSVPPILPRERLTKKARAAIEAYANHQAETKLDGYRMAHFMIDWILEAERMRRADLYARLTAWGYRWRPRLGFWNKKKESNQ